MSQDPIQRSVARLAESALSAGIQPGDELGAVLAEIGTVAVRLAEAAERLQAVGSKAPPLEREIVAAIERSNAAIAHRIGGSINRRTSMLVAVALFMTAAGSGLVGYFARGPLVNAPCRTAMWNGGR